jgi:hypothetical protein
MERFFEPLTEKASGGNPHEHSGWFVYRERHIDIASF